MISFYENNERIPPADILIKLSLLFQVSTDYLLGLSEYQNYENMNIKITVTEDENKLISIYRKLDKDYKEIINCEARKYLKMQEYMQAFHASDQEKKQA